MPHEADEQPTNVITADSEAFRTYWVQLPLDKASEVKEQIKAACGWSRHVWHARIHGKSLLTVAEKALINKIVGTNIFNA